jgi:hypothetical protein
MKALKMNKRFAAIALMLIVSAFFISGTNTYAAADPEADGSPHDAEISILEKTTPPPDVRLIVREVWLTGDTLHISVADGAEGQIIELNLRDYAMPGDEYVTIKATDNYGRESNSITFKNPYYQSSGVDNNQSESAVPGGARPFTPDGTGTVLDNVTEANGKEFFSITTEDGNIFYLIVDRQRNTDNVYLLNAVTEYDLASLAKPGDGRTVSAVETPLQPPVTPTQPETTPAPTPTPDPVPVKNSNTATLAFIGIAALIIGGAAYYFKIVRPKKNGGFESDYEPEDDDFGDDDVVDLDSGGEDGDDE